MNTRETHPSDLTEVKRPSASRPGSGRRILGAVALAATVPYLGLKTVWLCGSHLGIPEGSVLREPGPFFNTANAVTLAMDACVILLVLVLTRPWGIRAPGPLLTVPVFVATGLLTPILLGFSGQLLVRALGFGAERMGQAAREPFLDPWVFHVVYTGFSIQGLALAALFVPYARERWGRAWRGVTGSGCRRPRGWWRQPRRPSASRSRGCSCTGPSEVPPVWAPSGRPRTPRTRPWCPRSTRYARSPPGRGPCCWPGAGRCGHGGRWASRG